MWIFCKVVERRVSVFVMFWYSKIFFSCAQQKACLSAPRKKASLLTLLIWRSCVRQSLGRLRKEREGDERVCVPCAEGLLALLALLMKDGLCGRCPPYSSKPTNSYNIQLSNKDWWGKNPPNFFEPPNPPMFLPHQSLLDDCIL